MLIALGAKTKLGFIDGKISMPARDSAEYDNWKKVDYMVMSWILNSLSKDIVDAFIYVDSAYELWTDLAERFGESNGPLLYQIQKEISNLNQGTLSIAVYFTKLKKLWDEYTSLVSWPNCTCGAVKHIAEMESHTKLIKFLMGLNDSFDYARSQILLMEPLPNLNKAYSMLVKIERQRSAHDSFSETMDNSALLSRANGGDKPIVRRFNPSTPGGFRGKGFQRMSKEEKTKLICDHCGVSGHEINECFKLHGYPDWFKKFREQKKGVVANLADTTQQPPVKGQNFASAQGLQLGGISNLIQQEIAKFMTQKGTTDAIGSSDTGLHYAHFAAYAGPED